MSCEKIFLTCRAAFVIPQSWADVHLPWIAAHPSATLSESGRYIYQQCLVQLVIGFCRMLSRLDEAFDNDPDFGYCFSGRKYSRWILQRRNAELLAIAIVNLGSTSALVRGFADAWVRAREVRCQLSQVKSRFDRLTSHTSQGVRIPSC